MQSVYNNEIHDNPWKEELDFCWYTGMRHLHAWLIYQSNLQYWYKYEYKFTSFFFIDFSYKNYAIKFLSQGLGCP